MPEPNGRRHGCIPASLVVPSRFGALPHPAIEPQGGELFGYDLGKRLPTLEDDMPLLDAFVRRYEAAQPLRGVTALLIQHQLANQAPQVEAMIRLGLDPRSIYWLDIPYTSSERFRIGLSDRVGIPESNFWVNRYRVLEPYATHQFRRTQEALRHLIAERPEKLLVLDDGAYFLEAAMGFRSRLPDVGIVEQTTRGMIKIRENASLRRHAGEYPIVNVADSWPKRTLESPWIGIAVRVALTYHLARLAERRPEFAVPGDAPCLVLGFGTIGRQVAAYLRRSGRVHVYDTSPERRDEARRSGFAVWDRDRDPVRFKLVVGCSGRASFGVGDREYLDEHAVLASASSGSVELSRGDFIDLAAASQIDDIRVDTRDLVEDQIHQALHVDLVDRQVVFLNAGFPINFDGRLSCVPARYMQPTAMLMVQGALQAVLSSTHGPIAVNEEFCAELACEFDRHLAPVELEALHGRGGDGGAASAFA